MLINVVLMAIVGSSDTTSCQYEKGMIFKKQIITSSKIPSMGTGILDNCSVFISHSLWPPWFGCVVVLANTGWKGCADWGRHAPQYFQICKKVVQKSAMLQESWQQYFLLPIF